MRCNHVLGFWTKAIFHLNFCLFFPSSSLLRSTIEKSRKKSKEFSCQLEFFCLVKFKWLCGKLCLCTSLFWASRKWIIKWTLLLLVCWPSYFKSLMQIQLREGRPKSYVKLLTELFRRRPFCCYIEWVVELCQLTIITLATWKFNSGVVVGSFWLVKSFSILHSEQKGLI